MNWALIPVLAFLLAVVLELEEIRRHAAAIRGQLAALVMREAIGRQVPVVQPPPTQPEAQAKPGSGRVFRVMRQYDNGTQGDWIPAEYVREGSSAYQTAMDTPGIALQEPGGGLILGQQ